MTLENNLLPQTDEQLRLCCLRIAVSCAEPEKHLTALDVITNACKLFTYVKSGHNAESTIVQLERVAK